MLERSCCPFVIEKGCCQQFFVAVKFVFIFLFDVIFVIQCVLERAYYWDSITVTLEVKGLIREGECYDK